MHEAKEGLEFRKSHRRSSRKKTAKQNVTTSIKSKSQVIKDIKLKEIMEFAGVSLIESTSIPTESHAATPMQSDLINI